MKDSAGANRDKLNQEGTSYGHEIFQGYNGSFFLNSFGSGSRNDSSFLAVPGPVQKFTQIL